jgi:hypothetical protein
VLLPRPQVRVQLRLLPEESLELPELRRPEPGLLRRVFQQEQGAEPERPVSRVPQVLRELREPEQPPERAWEPRLGWREA